MTDFKNGDKVQHKHAQGRGPFRFIGWMSEGRAAIEARDGYAVLWEKNDVEPYVEAPEVGATYATQEGVLLFHVLEIREEKVFGRVRYESQVEWYGADGYLDEFRKAYPKKVEDDA